MEVLSIWLTIICGELIKELLECSFEADFGDHSDKVVIWYTHILGVSGYVDHLQHINSCISPFSHNNEHSDLQISITALSSIQFSVPQIEYPLGGSSKKGSHVYFLLQVFWVILLFFSNCTIVWYKCQNSTIWRHNSFTMATLNRK